MKDFSLDDVFANDAVTQTPATPANDPAPVARPVAPPVNVPDAFTLPSISIQQRGTPWSTYLLIAVLAFGAGYFFSNRGGIDIDPTPDNVVVDPVNGTYVAIFHKVADFQSYSASQQEFLNSANTADWLESKGVDWQKIEDDQDISQLPKPFQIMAEKHRSKLPWIVIATGKGFASEPIESNEQAMALLKKWVK